MAKLKTQPAGGAERLLGSTWEEVLYALNVESTAETNNLKPDSSTDEDFAVLIDGNMYTFHKNRLIHLRVNKYKAATKKISGFNLPVKGTLEGTLAKLNKRGYAWSFKGDHYLNQALGIRLEAKRALYYYVFIGKRYQLDFIVFSALSDCWW